MKEKSRQESETVEKTQITPKRKIMDDVAMGRALMRISHEITEKNRGVENVVLVGVLRRGVPLAKKIAENLALIEGKNVSVGSIDITFYRDDLTHVNAAPELHGTDIPFSLEGRDVVIVDDVIFTGRTVRAAIEGLFRLGRPATVQLAVLVDRGLRELPFKPDFVGKNIPTSRSEVVRVCVEEFDGEDSVSLCDITSDEKDR